MVHNINTQNMYMKNKRITELFDSSSLRNKRCFILAGGECLANLDFSRFKNEFTIGINRNFEKYPTNLLYCMDNEIYQRIVTKQLDEFDKSNVYEKFVKFGGVKAFLAVGGDIEYKHNCYVVNRIYSEEFNFEDLDKGIYTGNNSAFGAIMLAVSMGCKDIYLLGYSMKAVNKSHHHSGYPDRNLAEFNRTLDTYKNELYKWSTKFRNEDINITHAIINDEDETCLNCFSKRPLKSILGI